MSDLALSRIDALMKIRETVDQLTDQLPWEPPCDWFETDEHLLLVVDLPGVTSDSLEFSQDDSGKLLLSGRRGGAPDSAHPISLERPQARFERELEPPRPAVPGSARATLQSGLLTVWLEKREKTIDIGSAR